MEGTIASVNALLETSSQSIVTNSQTVPVLGCSSGAQQLWPLSHSVALYCEEGCLKTGALIVSLIRVHMSKQSELIGQATLTLSNLPATADGSFLPFDGIKLEQTSNNDVQIERTSVNHVAGVGTSPTHKAKVNETSDSGSERDETSDNESSHEDTSDAESTLKELMDDSVKLEMPSVSKGFMKASDSATCSLEVRHWSYSANLDRLIARVPKTSQALERWSAVDCMPRSILHDGGCSGVPVILEALVNDHVMKQAALERLQRSANVAQTREELAVWRINALDGKNRALLSDVVELRGMLSAHSVGLSKIGAKELSGLSREQLEERVLTQSALSKLERRKNSELVKRLRVRSSKFVFKINCFLDALIL